MKYQIQENETEKRLVSSDYNYYFNKQTGLFIRWGATEDEDPQFCPFGPEIADIEITTICGGPRAGLDTDANSLCRYCYKNNTKNGENMSIDTFKKVFAKLVEGKVVTQIAFGADSGLTSNPDTWAIMDHTRQNGVIPNVTVADINDDVADKLAKHCGAVAVSRHGSKDVCYESVFKLTSRGMKQVNIHAVVSLETFDRVMETVEDIKTDKRLAGLNAIVLLGLKKKGRGDKFQKLLDDQFEKIVLRCNELGVSYGFDSCSAPKFAKVVSINDTFAQNRHTLLTMTESCESGLFSSYINVHGFFSPCSFIDKTPGWEKGLDVANCNNFLQDIWYSESLSAWRKHLLENLDERGQRTCPVWDV